MISRRHSIRGGFTLLEMMVALSILAMALVWLVEATTQAISAENHAKLVTTATFLARQQLVELEDLLQEKGMTDDAFASEVTGDFDEAGFKRFKWRRLVDKITLPGTDVVQTAMGKALTGGADSKDPASTLGGMGGMGGAGGGGAGLLANQFGIIKEVLEQGIRRVTVKITWTENGAERVVEVSEYITDPRRIDQAIQIPVKP